MLPLAASTLSAMGAGITVIGASIGIGLLWSVGLQSMARQPELQPKIAVSMLIGAALLEAVALFALVICFMQI